MPDIDIQHPTLADRGHVRAAIERVAERLSGEFGLQCEWRDADTLGFERDGVQGDIKLAADHVHVTAALGFPYSLMKGMIESEIRRVLADKLG